jgi:hypothetical protein
MVVAIRGPSRKREIVIMKLLKWWLRIVGALYLMEGIGLSLAAFLDPDQFAAIWASSQPGALDEVAVRGIRLAGLPGVLTWVLLGAMMWMFSRVPAQARVLVIVVAAWELLVWMPLDLVGLLNGFEVFRALSLIAIHAAIGISGILVLRRAQFGTPDAAQYI